MNEKQLMEMMTETMNYHLNLLWSAMNMVEDDEAKVEMFHDFERETTKNVGMDFLATLETYNVTDHPIVDWYWEHCLSAPTHTKLN